MNSIIQKIKHFFVEIFEKKYKSNVIHGIVGVAVAQDNNSHTAANEYNVPKPSQDGFVRLVSALSQDIYTDVPIEDFCEVTINSKGLQETNHFLLSLWNEMNTMLHPQKSEYIPWFYRPDIVATGQNWKLVMLGDVHTSAGNFYMMLKMKDKSSIKSILAYNSHMPLDYCKTLFEQLVSSAKKNVNNLRTYMSTVRLKCKNFDIDSISIYGGRNFYLHSDDKGICIDIRLQAIDFIEAKQQIVKRLDELISFLTVETNLLFEIEGDVEIEESSKSLLIAINQEFIKPYIDGPSIRERVLRLSEAGVKFLDQFIFVDRDQVEDDVVLYFKRGCNHIHEGLQRQLEKGDKIWYTTKTQSYILTPKDQPRSQNIITMAAMSYLSALETASTPEGKTETCPKCGGVIYKISARIESLVSKYINPETGREFKELYNLRSKFLHAGKLSCENYFITARPFVDPNTGSGLTDYGFISCKVKGKIMIAGVNNIQELTTYVLRCYYQDKLFGVTDFEPFDDHGNDVDLKQMIMDKMQEVMPEGIEVEGITIQ